MSRLRSIRVVLLGVVAIVAVVLGVLYLPKVVYRAALYAQTGGTYDPVMVNASGHGVVPVPVASSTRTLRGHQGSVRALAFFPDGRRLASGGDDRTIRIWDLEANTSVAVKGHDGAVYALAVSSDGARLVSGGADSVARVWDVTDGKMIAQLEGHTAPVRGVGFIGRDRVITASEDGTLRVWDVKDEQQLAEWEAEEAGVHALSVSKDGTRAAAVGDEGTICVWDIARATCVWRFRPQQEDAEDGRPPGTPVASPAVALTPDGNRVFTLEPDGQLGGWDVGNPTPKDTLQGTNAQQIALSADGASFVAVSDLEAAVFATNATDRAAFRSAILPDKSLPEAAEALNDQIKSGKPPTQELMQQLARESIGRALNRPVPCSTALSPDGSRGAVGLGLPNWHRPENPEATRAPPAAIVLFDRPRPTGQ